MVALKKKASHVLLACDTLRLLFAVSVWIPASVSLLGIGLSRFAVSFFPFGPGRLCAAGHVSVPPGCPWAGGSTDSRLQRPCAFCGAGCSLAHL